MFGKIAGSSLLIVSSSIGAGILALPMVGAPVGFGRALLILFLVYAASVITGLVTLRVALACDARSCTFSGMAERTLGRWGKMATTATMACFLYSALSAYTTGSASILSMLVPLPSHINTALFVIICGWPVVLGTRIAVLVNGWLISAKMLILITAIAVLFVSCPDLSLLHVSPNATPKNIYAMTSMAVCAFCYHMVIPSVRIYAGENRRILQYSIVGGMTLVFLVYAVWLAVMLGAVPSEVMASTHTVQGLVQAMEMFSKSRVALFLITLFSQITMLVSFVAVSLSLFDTLMDFFRFPDTARGRIQTALATFLPPTMFVVLIPDGFLLALKYTAIFGFATLMVLPCIMAWRIRSLP